MKLIDITTLAGTFTSEKELREYSDQQYKTIAKQQETIKRLEDEVFHLQNLVKSTTDLMSDNKIEKLIVTHEEAILEAQVKILHDRALSKELTLEDTKKLDLLIKNLSLLKGKNTTIVGSSKKLDISDAQLVQLAKLEK